MCNEKNEAENQCSILNDKPLDFYGSRYKLQSAHFWAFEQVSFQKIAGDLGNHWLEKATPKKWSWKVPRESQKKYSNAEAVEIRESREINEPKCVNAWYVKCRRGIVKSLRNKVHPQPVTRIQESDGGFFENLGEMFAEKVRIQELAEGPLPSKTTDEKIDLEDATCLELSEITEECTEPILESDSDRDENEHTLNLLTESVGWNIEELYSTLVYMTQNQIGYDVSNECGQEVLLEHLRQAFKVDDQSHERVLDETRNMEAPEMRLSVEVIEAKELVSKDANGLSDPFCALYLESVPTRRYNTAVKPATLTPIWEEYFDLPLKDPENDVLQIEVWDFDAAETVPEKMSKVKNVKGVKGLVKLAKEIAVTATTGNHDNEFIGRSRIPLKDIPVAGHSMWYPLEKKNKSKRRGVVRLRLAFSAEHTVQVAIQEHRHLLRILLLHELESEKTAKYCWAEKWSPASRMLILQHSVQRGLVPAKVCLAKWIEYSKVHVEHALSFTVFDDLIRELARPLENSLIFSEDEIKLFWDATKRLLYSCLNCIRKIRRFPLEGKCSIVQLNAILGILSSLSSLRVPESVELFPAKMYGWLMNYDIESLDITRALEYTVIQGGAEWFDYILSKETFNGHEDEEALKYHIKVIQLIRNDLQKATDVYDKHFIKKVNFPYVKTLYVMYEKRVSDMCMVIVEDVCGRLKRVNTENSDDVAELSLGTTLFELYLTLQRYSALGRILCTDDLEYMKVQNCHEWFRGAVAHWLEIATYKALRRIDRAVEYDTLQPVDSSVKYSSSAVDTLTIFYQIKVFWTQLAWPDAEGSYTFVAKIIDDICKCCISYADRMAEKTERAAQEEHELGNSGSVYEKKFQVSNMWCYAINNIDYIRTSIIPLTNDLGLQSIIDTLGENKTQQEAERCRQTLQLIIDNTTETVKNKIVDLLEVVASKMAPAMCRYLTEGAELIDTTSNAMDRLLQYLDSNLSTLHENFNEDNFERILHVIWEIMAETLHELVNNNLEKRRPPSFYSNLHRTLDTLIRFFNLGADETANVRVLEKIEKLLKLYGHETAELIHLYHLERLEEQRNLENSVQGLVTVQARFIDNSLTIKILNARNLTQMDSNGKSDPYVKIKLLPEEKFADAKSMKTRVLKETLYPLFDEKFSVDLTSEQRELENAIVAFEVKDKDLFRTRFMAEAFLPFNAIPATGPDQSIESLEQVHLKLSRPTNRDSDIIRALEHRKGDNLAMDFISRFKSKFQAE